MAESSFKTAAQLVVSRGLLAALPLLLLLLSHKGRVATVSDLDMVICSIALVKVGRVPLQVVGNVLHLDV